MCCSRLVLNVLCFLLCSVFSFFVIPCSLLFALRLIGFFFYFLFATALSWWHQTYSGPRAGHVSKLGGENQRQAAHSGGAERHWRMARADLLGTRWQKLLCPLLLLIHDRISYSCYENLIIPIYVNIIFHPHFFSFLCYISLVQPVRSWYPPRPRSSTISSATPLKSLKLTVGAKIRSCTSTILWTATVKDTRNTCRFASVIVFTKEEESKTCSHFLNSQSCCIKW